MIPQFSPANRKFSFQNSGTFQCISKSTKGIQLNNTIPSETKIQGHIVFASHNIGVVPPPPQIVKIYY